MSGVSFRPIGLIVGCLTVLMLGFQNCATDIQFSPDANLKADPGTSSDVPGSVGQNGGMLDNPESSNNRDNSGSPAPSEEDDAGTLLPPNPVAGQQPPREVICDPLAPSSEMCEPPPSGGGGGSSGGTPPPGGPLPPSGGAPEPGTSPGLMGDLYYLSRTAHGDLFDGNLNNAHLDDYQEFGTKTPFAVVMTQVNVTPRSWQDSFTSNMGNTVVDDQDNVLLEWFSLRLSGQIKLPAGSYQFAMISDDGMRVTIDNVPILNHDGVHAPALDCASIAVSFNGQDAKPIQVAYFQGPRVEIAMQLLVRPLSEDNGRCRNDGSWQTIPASAYSH
ncbi:MAG: hypothetical protein H6624_02815 [Bdellovibrionaceae bacterium]|nr:hypothetical protein [Bdellovibrionales bacterium]MCB9083244.1 hypothetical protein [Pseudobdellovibrionaceae bacterium]